MFPNTFESRRTACRAAFLAAAVAPTLIVALFAAWRVSGIERAAIEDRLSRELGLRLALDGVRHPAPGRLRLVGLRLSDPESQAEILAAATVDLETAGNESLLAAVGLRISLDAAEPLCDLLRRRLARQGGGRGWRLAPCACLLQGPQGAQSLDHLRAAWQPAQPGRPQSTFTIHAELPGSRAFDSLRLSVTRNHAARPAEVEWDLQTRDAPFPCAWLTPIVDVTPWVGSSASFQGYLWVKQQEDSYHARATGWLREVDLHQLVTARFPHVIRGEPATLEIAELQVVDGRLRLARGELSAGAGRVSRSLLDGAARQLQLAGPPPGIPSELVAFDRLQLQFSLDDDALQVAAGKDAGGQVLGHGGRPLLQAPANGTRVAPLSLVRLLAPHNEHLVPATRETEALARFLPLPSVTAGEDRPTTVSGRFIRVSPVQRR